MTQAMFVVFGVSPPLTVPIACSAPRGSSAASSACVGALARGAPEPRSTEVKCAFNLPPVVVLVSRLLFGRRSVRSEGAARAERRATRARRARRAARAARVYHGWLITAAVEQGCRGALRCYSPPRFFSRPVRRSACAAPSLHPRAGGSVRTTSERADARRVRRGICLGVLSVRRGACVCSCWRCGRRASRPRT